MLTQRSHANANKPINPRLPERGGLSLLWFVICPLRIERTLIWTHGRERIECTVYFGFRRQQLLTNKLINWHATRQHQGLSVEKRFSGYGSQRIGEKNSIEILLLDGVRTAEGFQYIFISYVAAVQEFLRSVWFTWCLFIFYISQLWIKHLWVFSLAPPLAHSSANSLGFFGLFKYVHSKAKSNQNKSAR